MNILKILHIAIIISFAVTGCTATKGKVVESRPQTVCPVMGGKIDSEVYVDHEGKRVYFCCAGCIAKFKENPSKYIKVLEIGYANPEKGPGEGKQHSCKDISPSDSQGKAGCSCGGCRSKCNTPCQQRGASR